MIKSQVCGCTLGYAVDDNFKETVHGPGTRVSTNKGILKGNSDITAAQAADVMNFPLSQGSP